ncbi:carboxypeptidase-like regulatory domain-containing protein [Fibrella arboris]|uniref:carboxypeptidase-like regulatory domain-containing protein n=1 Tax=Fibrella arboris TaxID=3242486 RepID=UPI0035228159
MTRICRRYLLLIGLLLGLCRMPAWAQAVQHVTLSGRITNASDGQPLPFASVYLNGTTRGVTTDEKGQFSLTNVPFGASELVVSYTGFTAVRQPIRITEAKPQPIAIALLPMANMLTDVVVTAKKDKTWQRQLAQFEQDMIGNSAFARQCTIVNPEVLLFDEPGGYLMATAREPLLIDNLALGYRLIYSLRAFRSEARTAKVLFGGTTLFKELTPASPKQAKQWQRNREQAYQGSLRHLLASLVAGNHEQEGFLIFQTDLTRPLPANGSPVLSTELGRHLKAIDVKTLVTPGTLAHERWLTSDSPIEVLYTKVSSNNSPYVDAKFAFSQLVLPQKTLGFTITGQITAPRGFEAVGFLSNDRLANALPDDWQQDGSAATQLATARLDSVRRTQVENRLPPGTLLDTLVQRWQRQAGKPAQPVFVQVDKPLYMTGERLWLSGYVLDALTQQCDTAEAGPALSVELWTSTNSPLQHVWLPVSHGRAAGSLHLSDTLSTGTYWLRAYTETDLPYNRPAFERPIWVVNHETTVGGQEEATSQEKAIVTTPTEFVEEVLGAPYRTTMAVDSGQLALTLDARSKTRFPTAYALIESRGRLVQTAYVPVRSASTTVRWSTRTWPPGTVLLSLMDSTGRIWTKRTIRIPDRTAPILASIQLSRSATTSSADALLIKLHDETGRPIAAHASVSVTDAERSPADSLVPAFPAYLQAIDSRQSIKQSVAGVSGITLHGQLSTAEKQPVNVKLIIVDRNGVSTRVTQTDATGHFQVGQLFLSDTAQVLVQVTNRKGKPVEANVSFNPYAMELGTLPFTPDATLLFRQWRKMIETAKQRQAAEPGLYRDSPARQLAEVVVRTAKSIDERPAAVQLRSLHNQVDQTIVLNKDATGFANLYSLIRAKIPNLRVDEVLTTGRTAYSVSFPGAASMLNAAVAPLTSRGAPPPPPVAKPATGIQNPFFLVDGFPIDDTDGTQLLAFSPASIERIEVLKIGATAAMYGTQASRGIIAFYSRVTRDVAKMKGVTRHRVAGYPTAVPFSAGSPVVDTKPDLRDVLAWEPLASIDKTGQLVVPVVVSSSARKLRVTIQGVSTSGRAFSVVQWLQTEPSR